MRRRTSLLAACSCPCFFLAACAPSLKLEKSFASTNLCFTPNPELSREENDLLDSIATDTTSSKLHLHRSCERSDSIPTLTIRPVSVGYTTTTLRVTSTIVTAGTAFWTGYALAAGKPFILLWLTPSANYAYEISVDKKTIGDSHKLVTTAGASYFGDHEVQRRDLVLPLR